MNIDQQLESLKQQLLKQYREYHESTAIDNALSLRLNNYKPVFNFERQEFTNPNTLKEFVSSVSKKITVQRPDLQYIVNALFREFPDFRINPIYNLDIEPQTRNFYAQRIPSPIGLSQIQQNLNGYSTLSQFVFDLFTIITNSLDFNFATVAFDSCTTPIQQQTFQFSKRIYELLTDKFKIYKTFSLVQTLIIKMLLESNYKQPNVSYTPQQMVKKVSELKGKLRAQPGMKDKCIELLAQLGLPFTEQLTEKMVDDWLYVAKWINKERQEV
ncbi:Bromodomain [Hexamita inflata]|uniref:Bromodomain n=1 Tax=Hexamita inflata TaxID=28002 RepID=A0ABP1KTG6_9EUKA